MINNRKKKLEEEIRKIVSSFINEHTNRTSLITVTRVDVSPNLAKVDLYVTVFPESGEESALNFLKRKRPEVKEAIKRGMNIRRIPFVDFEIDMGEKNRQKINELL